MLDQQLIIQSLSEHPFSKDLDSIHVETLAHCARLCRLQAGDYLWHQGEAADCLFMISSGQLALEISIPLEACWRIDTLGAGQVVGWLWLGAPHRWQLDARAITPLFALCLDSKCLREICGRYPPLGREVINRFTEAIAQRLEATQRMLLEMIGVEQKVKSGLTSP